MTDPTNDIDALLRYLKSGHTPHWYDDSKRWRAVLTALVAERNALREQLRLANIDQFNTEAEANDRDRDLRERLVCAALTGLCSDPSVDMDESGSRAAVAIADRTLAAMRKGESRE